MKKLLFFLFIPSLSFAQQFSPQEIAKYKSEAQQVTIVRDTWGIPHIYGKTDADAVFGLLYAQCEDDFKRVERNYLQVMGQLSEVDGDRQLYNDLQLKLIEDSADAKKDYQKSPAWFQKLLNSFADGVNYYLATHPTVKPAILKRFEPWFPLMFTDGSIGATQTGGATTQDTKELYGKEGLPTTAIIPSNNDMDVNTIGSNGFAIAPSKTASKNAILYINPHVTFYFRPEVQMVSEEGLNAYGAVTWGQFFVYQGFNEHCGWMHTSSYADVADLYEEKIIKKGDSLFYQYNNELRPVRTKRLVVNYKKGDSITHIPVTAYYTHHGPVIGSRNGQWLSLKENNRSLNALLQSWLRTKAKNFAEFEKIMQLRSNGTNNTVYADDKGNIAYWHGNFIPIRDPALDWSQPVDGTTPATEWKGIHPLNEIIHIYNPASGWIQNCNSTPFTASGSSSPKKSDYPVYMAPDPQNFRAVNAVRLLSNENNFTLDKIMKAGYDHYLAAFDVFLPPLFKAYDDYDSNDSIKSLLKEPIQILKDWDKRSSLTSVATTLAIEWGYKVYPQLPSTKNFDNLGSLIAAMPTKDKLTLLVEVTKELQQKFGTWKVAWGDINRYQRTTGQLEEKYDDNKPSLAVPMTSSTWGSLPAFEGRYFPGTKKRYGIGGNSFIAAVEFGKTVKAKSILAGGESSNPASKHFTDQAPLLISGTFKDVWFYKTEVMQHVESQYHPGEEK